jgi:hypothetical protein
MSAPGMLDMRARARAALEHPLGSTAWREGGEVTVDNR